MTEVKSIIDRFRPIKPSNFMGKQQRKYALALERAVEDGNPIQFLLLTGITGTGKTSLALMYAKMLLSIPPETPNKDINSFSMDYHQHDCAANSGKGDIRSIIPNLASRPLASKYRVFFFEEFHDVTKQGQRALLSSLEADNCPATTICIFCAESTAKIDPAFVSRMTHMPMSVCTVSEASTLLKAYNKYLDPAVELTKDQLQDILEHPEVNGSYRAFAQTINSIHRGVRSIEEYEGGLASSDSNLFQLLNNPKTTLSAWMAGTVEMNSVQLVRTLTTYFENNLSKRNVSFLKEMQSAAGLALTNKYHYNTIAGEKASHGDFRVKIWYWCISADKETLSENMARLMAN